MKEFIVNDVAFNEKMKGIVDSKQIFAAGFSYGAATSALSVVNHKNDYKACILLDGWFNIDYDGKGGFDFPKKIHENGKCCFTLLYFTILYTLYFILYMMYSV